MGRPSQLHPGSCQHNRGCEGTHTGSRHTVAPIKSDCRPVRVCLPRATLTHCTHQNRAQHPDTAVSHTQSHKRSATQSVTGAPTCKSPTPITRTHTTADCIWQLGMQHTYKYTTIQHRKGTWHLLHRHNTMGTSERTHCQVCQNSQGPRNNCRCLQASPAVAQLQVLMARTMREPAANRASTQAAMPQRAAGVSHRKLDGPHGQLTDHKLTSQEETQC